MLLGSHTHMQGPGPRYVMERTEFRAEKTHGLELRQGRQDRAKTGWESRGDPSPRSTLHPVSSRQPTLRCRVKFFCFFPTWLKLPYRAHFFLPLINMKLCHHLSTNPLLRTKRIQKITSRRRLQQTNPQTSPQVIQKYLMFFGPREEFRHHHFRIGVNTAHVSIFPGKYVTIY